jgi:SAM-dependent methyltransferase
MLLDVLEHVRDDWLALAQACRVLQPGGRALITVPAFPSLWSPHDAAEMHIRRYRRAGLLRLCESVGLRVIRSGHFNILLFLPAVAWRILSRRLYRHRVPRDDFYMLPRPINDFLAALFALERFLLPHVPAPLGLSIFAVLEKPGYTGSTAPEWKRSAVAKHKGGAYV